MAVKTIGNMQLDELIASGRSPLHTRAITITGTTALKRGQLIGKTSDSTPKYQAFATGNTPVGILCEDLTPTSAGVKAVCYVSGHFNGNKVTGYTATLDEALNAIGIYVEKALTY